LTQEQTQTQSHSFFASEKGRAYLDAYSYLLPIAGTLILLDQLTKWWVLANIDFGRSWDGFDLEPFARLVYWQNRGAAFGWFQDGGMVFTILAIVVSIAIIYYFPQVPKEDWPLRLAMSLQLGGAVGNLIDRLRFGFVVDFISILDFPVFNIADASITAGVIVLLAGIWILERRERREAAEREAAALAFQAEPAPQPTTIPNASASASTESPPTAQPGFEPWRYASLREPARPSGIQSILQTPAVRIGLAVFVATALSLLIYQQLRPKNEDSQDD
jgi:signal peptidase II